MKERECKRQCNIMLHMFRSSKCKIWIHKFDKKFFEEITDNHSQCVAIWSLLATIVTRPPNGDQSIRNIEAVSLLRLSHVIAEHTVLQTPRQNSGMLSGSIVPICSNHTYVLSILQAPFLSLEDVWIGYCSTAIRHRPSIPSTNCAIIYSELAEYKIGVLIVRHAD